MSDRRSVILIKEKTTKPHFFPDWEQCKAIVFWQEKLLILLTDRLHDPVIPAVSVATHPGCLPPACCSLLQHD